MANYRYLDNGPDHDGTILGQTSQSPIALWGKTPGTQRSHVADVTTATVTTAATSTTPYGFATSTQANAIASIVDDLRTKFNTLLANMEAVGIHAES